MNIGSLYLRTISLGPVLRTEKYNLEARVYMETRNVDQALLFVGHPDGYETKMVFRHSNVFSCQQ